MPLYIQEEFATKDDVKQMLEAFPLHTVLSAPSAEEKSAMEEVVSTVMSKALAVRPSIVTTINEVFHWFIRHRHVDKGEVYGAEDYASRMQRAMLDFNRRPQWLQNVREKMLEILHYTI